jgi:hypothetical protein
VAVIWPLLVLVYRKGRRKLFSQEIKKIDLDVNCSFINYIVLCDCSGLMAGLQEDK